MSISIERLEKLFFEKLCIPRKNIENMLSHIIIAALTMHDPVKFIQDKFTYYNRQYYSARNHTVCGPNLMRWIILLPLNI